MFTIYSLGKYKLNPPMKYDCISMRMAKAKNKNIKLAISSVGKKTRAFLHCWWECEMVQSLLDSLTVFFYKVKHTLTI